MSKKIEKLVAVEHVIDTVENGQTRLPVGAHYVLLQDPETGKWYDVRPGVVLEGLDFESLFTEYPLKES